MTHPLVSFRLEDFLTQEALAKRAGVSLRTVSNIERKACFPHMSTRRRILRALRIPLSEHFEIFGPLPRQAWRRKRTER